MTIISPSNQLLAQMRMQALSCQQRIAKPMGVAINKDKQAAATADSTAPWLRQITQAMIAIDPNDCNRQRKAFRLFLKASLANELGIALINDQSFEQLVDRVQQTMESDVQLHAAMTTAGDMLLQNLTHLNL